MPTQTFYGKEIRGDIRETRVTQIYNILAREIRSGRWEVNSRFPSVTELTNESGLSRGSIQKVLSRLDADGLIATENRRGTFVTPQDTHPEPESSNPEPEAASPVEPKEPVLEPASSARSLAPAADPIPAPLTPSTPAEAEIESVSDESDPLDFSGNLFEEVEKTESEAPTSIKSSSASKRIGIALIKSNPMLQSAPQIENLTLLEALSEVLPANDFKTSVAFFDGAPDWEVLAGDDLAFGEPVDGIIAISSGGFIDLSENTKNTRPIVFVSGAESVAHPSITRDYALGAYRVTRDLIKAGHTKIIACPVPGTSTAEDAAILAGYRAAMNRVGLEINEEAIKQARSIPLSDLAALRDYIQQFRSATAVFCGSAQRAKDLVRLCDALGVLVPEDLSIASAGASAMRDDMTGGQLSGFGFAAEDLAEAAVSMLGGILVNGTSRFSQVKVPPQTDKGHSAGEPRRAKQNR